MKFIPTILSGGSGTRLWPVSRSKFPKQFCELFDESLFLKTLLRLKPFGSPWVVTNQSMKVLTDSFLSLAGISSEQALYEPEARNTAPAIALLCKVLASKGEANSIVGVFPSDHLIQNLDHFKNAIQLGIECARKGQVVTLGIKPTFPSTGYGYIEVKEDSYLQSSSLTAFQTKGFHEKPNETLAREFIQSGNFYWNGGMFIFEVATMIKNLSMLMPDLWSEISNLKPDLSNLKEVYSQCPTQSIDYGIMEKLSEQVCVPCDLGWNDVGSWDELSKLTETSETIEVGGKGNFAFSKQGRVTAFIDTDDLIVVDSADSILVSKKGSTQKVKSVVESLQARQDKRANEHPFEYRPWGRFEILRDTHEFKSKVIHVNPGQQLSYQSHAKRAEHWVITKGHPEVVLNDVTHKLQPGESIYIPLGAKHRIRNPGQSEVVEFVEVQVGSYFGEDDIVRYQDDYKRS